MTDETTNKDQKPKDRFRSAFGSFFDHQRRAVEETGKAFDSLLPPEFKEHSAVARDEFRKGLKVLVDTTIDELENITKEVPKRKSAPGTDDDSNTDDPPSTTGRAKVKVQVE